MESGIELYKDDYAWHSQQALPIIDREKSVLTLKILIDTDRNEIEELKQKLSFIATLGAPGSGKTTFLKNGLEQLRLSCPTIVPLYVSFNDSTSILPIERTELREDNLDLACNCFVRRILYSYYCWERTVSWDSFASVIGDISIKLDELFIALRKDYMNKNPGHSPSFVLGVDEIMKLDQCNNFSGVLSKFCNQIDHYRKQYFLKVVMTTLEGYVFFKQFNAKFVKLQSGICRSITQSQREIYWINLLPLSFGPTFDSFKRILSVCEDKLKHVAIAIAVCAGHPRSLDRLLQIICKNKDKTVWQWIEVLQSLELKLPPISPKQFMCCLAACLTNTTVAEQTVTYDELTFGSMISLGYIVNSITQNSEFVPRVPPLFLHKLHMNYAFSLPQNPEEKELNLLSDQLHHMLQDVFTCIEHRSWETFISRFFLLRLWGHVKVYNWKKDISDVTTTIQLSQLFNVDDDHICGRDIPLTIGVHHSLMTCMYTSHLKSCWRNVENFQPCTFGANQPGFDILCKMDDTLLLFENKWSDLNSMTSFNVNELKTKLALTKQQLKKIQWHEKQTVWVAVVWRSQIPEREQIKECVSQANFGGHVIILQKEAIRLWLGPMFDSMPALNLSLYDNLPK